MEICKAAVRLRMATMFEPQSLFDQMNLLKYLGYAAALILLCTLNSYHSFGH